MELNLIKEIVVSVLYEVVKVHLTFYVTTNLNNLRSYVNVIVKIYYVLLSYSSKSQDPADVKLTETVTCLPHPTFENINLLLSD